MIKNVRDVFLSNLNSTDTKVLINLALKGFGVIFHAIGSSLFKWNAIFPSLVSSIATLILSLQPEAVAWLTTQFRFTESFFNCIAFLLTVAIMTRLEQAFRRYFVGLDLILEMQTSLYASALFFHMLLTSSRRSNQESTATQEEEEEKKSINEHLMKVFLRWIREFHVLAFEEIQGIEATKEKFGTCTPEEYEILEKVSTGKPTIILTWMITSISRHRKCFHCEDMILSRLHYRLNQAHSRYVAALSLGESPLAFPVAQVATFGIVMYAILSPPIWAVEVPNSFGFSMIISFLSNLMLFSTNFAAASLEAPFDADENCIPLKYYSIRFHDDIINILFEKFPSDVDFNFDKKTEQEETKVEKDNKDDDDAQTLKSQYFQYSLSICRMKEQFFEENFQLEMSLHENRPLTELRARGKFSRFT